MLRWRVKIESPEHSNLGEILHNALNAKNPADLETACRIVAEEAGVDYRVTRSESEISVHDLGTPLDRLACTPPRVLTITYNADNPSAIPKSSEIWEKTLPWCRVCGKSHRLFFLGQAAPASYGFECPVHKQTVVHKSDPAGWVVGKGGDVRTYAISYERSGQPVD